MERYKHYSFDLWLTLIKSNPEFKNKRTELFFEMFNPNHLDFSRVHHIISTIDTSSNSFSELSQVHTPCRHMIFGILKNLGMKSITNKMLVLIEDRIQSIFLKYPPIVYSNSTEKVLRQLKEEGSTLSIGSNTGFIHGKTVREALKSLGIHDLFQFFVFSDEIYSSKPSPVFFGYVYDKVESIHKGILMEQILHVGDNPVADINGASNIGISSFLINSNNKSITDIL